MDRCKRCGQSDVEFYECNKSWCKECIRKRARESRLERLDQVREYDRVRGRTKERKAAVQAYSQTEKGRLAAARAKKAWAERNPEKRAAQIALGNAVRDGRVMKEPCEVCGRRKVHAHHDDYSKPLDVRWLCTKHHVEHHKRG